MHRHEPYAAVAFDRDVEIRHLNFVRHHLRDPVEEDRERFSLGVRSPREFEEIIVEFEIMMKGGVFEDDLAVAPVVPQMADELRRRLPVRVLPEPLEYLP